MISSKSCKDIIKFDACLISVIGNKIEGHLGGLVVERLPWSQVMVLGSWDRVPRRAPRREPASPSACVSASVCVSYEKIIFFKNELRCCQRRICACIPLIYKYNNFYKINLYISSRNMLGRIIDYIA